MSITAYLNLDRDCIDIECDYRDADRVKSIPGAKVRNHPETHKAQWYLPVSWAACYALRNTFRTEVEFCEELTSWVRWYHESVVTPAFTTRYAADGPTPFGAPEERGAYLRPYQRSGVEYLTGLKRGILADPMGTGKTEQAFETIETLARLHEDDPDGNHSPFPCIVVTPASVKHQWERAWHMQYPDRAIVVADGSAAKRRKAIQQVKDGEADVLVINYETLWRHSRLKAYGSVSLRRCEVCEPVHAEGQKQASCHWCLKELNTDDLMFGSLISDEAHMAKSPTASATRALWWVAHKQVRPGGPVIPMTGTPTESQLDDYWSMLHLIRPAEFPSKTAFMERFALMVPDGNGNLKPRGVNPMTRDEFYAVTEYLMLRRPKEVVATALPPKVYMEREAELAPKQRKTYKMVEKELMVRGLTGEEGGEGKERPAIEPAVAALRLKQAAAATLDVQTCETCEGSGVADVSIAHDASPHPDPEWAETHCWCAKRLNYEGPEHRTSCRACTGWGDTVELVEPSAKLDVVEELLDGDLAGKQVVIFYVHRRLADLLAVRLDKRKARYFRYDGSTTSGEREVGLRQFAIGELDIAMVSIDAGGTGVDGLQVANTAVYLQRHDSRIKNEQSEDRLHRMGAEVHDSVNYIDVLADVPVEGESAARLARKDGHFEDVVNDAETVRRLLRK